MRAVIFDVEGTLIDCVPQTLQSWQDTLATFGLTVPIEVLQLYSGMDGDEMLQLIAPRLDAAARQEAIEAEGQRYKERYLLTVRPFPGAHAVLRSLKISGVRIGIATDCATDELERYRRLLRADDLFDAVACGDEVQEGKPSSALVDIAVRKLGIERRHAVMIGDTPYDAEAARSAGVAVLGVLTGGFAAEALTESGCFAVLRDLREAEAVLSTHWAAMAGERCAS